MNIDWVAILAVIGGNVAVVLPLWLWARGESRSDWRHLDAKMDAMKLSTDACLKAIHEEMKDFHGRLCDLEVRKRKGL
jgi:hypothetical protein